MLKPLDTIFHVSFIVPNFERSLVFYKDSLGFKVVWERRNFRLNPSSKLLLSGGRLKGDDEFITGQVELIEFIEPKYTEVPPRRETDLGFWGVVFEVADLNAICRELKSKRVVFEREPEIHQVVSGLTNYSAIIHDIDGNRIELVQRV